MSICKIREQKTKSRIPEDESKIMTLTGLIFYQHVPVTPIRITDNCRPASIDKQTPLSLNSSLIASLVTGN